MARSAWVVAVMLCSVAMGGCPPPLPLPFMSGDSGPAADVPVFDSGPISVTDAGPDGATITDASYDAISVYDAISAYDVTRYDAVVDAVTTDSDSAGRRPYDLCANPGEACSSGATCTTANTTVDSNPPGTFCTAACNSPSDCPPDVSGFSAVCVVTRGVGECYRTCGESNACPAGFHCGGPSGMTQYCIPSTTGSCGHVGEACCPGSACSDVGAACGDDGRCAPTPYFGCAADAIGSACVPGFSSAGASVPTTCAHPSAGGTSAAGFCTTTCSSDAQCPASPISGRTVSCLTLAAGASAQCYLRCGGSASCPNGTSCVDVSTLSGDPISLCLP